MILYWGLFLYFAAGAVLERPKLALERRFDPLFWFGGLIIATVIGFRFEVGADWHPYLVTFQHAARISFAKASATADPGYAVLNWGVHQLDADFWLVNLVCGAIFTWGLLRFAQIQERPWLAMVIAIPYLVTVVAMGYTRQSASIGLVMAAIASYVRSGSALRFAVYVLAAASFHKTAVVTMPLIALGDRRSTFLNLGITALITYVMYQYFLSPSVDLLVVNYVERHYSSEGAGIRVAMSALGAALFLLRPSDMAFSDRERRIWRNFSLAGLALVPMLLLIPSSTAIDRLALYILPIQLVALSRPRILRLGQGPGVAAAIIYSAAILFVWLTFAVHARFWVPYKFWPFT